MATDANIVFDIVVISAAAVGTVFVAHATFVVSVAAVVVAVFTFVVVVVVDICVVVIDVHTTIRHQNNPVTQFHQRSPSSLPSVSPWSSFFDTHFI